MLYLLSPAKTLDYESPLPEGVAGRATRPQFVDEAAALIEVLRGYSPARIASLSWVLKQKVIPDRKLEF